MVKTFKIIIRSFLDKALRCCSKNITGSSIFFLILLLVFVENKFISFGKNITGSSATWMFILINVNVIILLLLILLVSKHIIKIIYDRKKKIIGAKIRSRLVIAFIFLSLLPAMFFLFPIKFIDTSIKSWFNTTIIEILENSTSFCDEFYNYVHQKQRLVVGRIDKEIKINKLYKLERRKDLYCYLRSIQQNYDLYAIGVYSESLNQIAFVASKNYDTTRFKNYPLNYFRTNNTLRKGIIGTELFCDSDLIHTVGTIHPYSDLTLHIICSSFINKDFYNKIHSINKSLNYYNTILSLKEPIQTTYYITLFVVTLFVVFCAIWFGFYLAKTIVTPIMNLVDGTRRIAEGDLSFTIEKTDYDDEIGNLVDSFNKMIDDFLTSQRKLKLSARKLKEQNREIEERRQYMEIVLKSVSAGVITLDSNGLITTFNVSAEKMLKLKASNALYSNYNKLFNSKHLKPIIDILDDLYKDGGKTFEIPFRITSKGFPNSLLLSTNVLQDENKNYIGVVMVFDDLTELERAQRMAAWREVARRIAHEVKNPLTPITLSAQRLRRKYSAKINEPIFVECIHMIIDHVDLIRNLVNEFSAFARFPTANPKPCKLPPIIEETVALYKEGHSKINFKCLINNKIPNINIDRRQFKQAMINLVDNAIIALKNEGYIVITVSYSSNLKLVRIDVSDNGPGIKDEDKIRLFEPNFSTKKSGMGLGLTIVNTIITDHNGIIHVHDNNPNGAKFVIELPVQLN